MSKIKTFIHYLEMLRSWSRYIWNILKQYNPELRFFLQSVVKQKVWPKSTLVHQQNHFSKHGKQTMQLIHTTCQTISASHVIFFLPTWVDKNLADPDTVIHLFQPDSLELRGHQVMFLSTTLQGQAGLSQELDKGFPGNEWLAPCVQVLL